MHFFFIMSHSVLLRMRSCRENENIHFMFITFFFNCAICERMWKNIVEPDSPQMTIWRMYFACWIPKATAVHSECVIIIALAQQQ
jgi:hypothetical protein